MCHAELLEESASARFATAQDQAQVQRWRRGGSSEVERHDF